MTRRARVGISAHLNPDTNVWGNGLNQNLLFLVQALRASPAVESVCILNTGTATALQGSVSLPGLDVELVRPADATRRIDLVIEMGAALPPEWIRRVRALGASVATFLVGHTYTSQSEPPMFGREGGMAFHGTPWDEIWTLESHMATGAAMLETVARAPVLAMPHIWSPAFLLQPIEEAKARGLHFGFRPDGKDMRRPWRVAIFEPNFSVGKCCFIPMLACEAAYRERHEAIELMMVMNSFHMKDNPTFNLFARELDLTRDGRSSYEPRLPFVDCMAGHRLDAVVAHHWEWGLNYAYYDALYGGYPLVHNSPYLQAAGVGFHYPGFEARKGAAALLAAWSREPGYWDGYRKEALRWLATLDPLHEANVGAFTARIRHLMEAAHGHA